MDELFPADDDDFLPNTKDVTDILNKTMPDDETSCGYSSSGSSSIHNNGGFSLSWQGIDQAAKKGCSILQELIGIEEDEAKDLAKKVIIPVLRSVSKDEAEAGKARFAEIGILARIKAG